VLQRVSKVGGSHGVVPSRPVTVLHYSSGDSRQQFVVPALPGTLHVPHQKTGVERNNPQREGQAGCHFKA
jgi:hypothetical protein